LLGVCFCFHSYGKRHSPRRNRLRHWLMFDVLDQFPPPLTQGPHQPPNL
jgi:hypothetical protein